MKKIFCVLVVLLMIPAIYALDVSVNDYDPKPAEAGKAVNVWFKVENEGTDSEKDVFIEVIPQDNLQLTPGEEAKKKIGIIPALSSDIVQYRLLVSDNAFEGAQTIEVRILKGTASSLKKDLTIEVTDKDFKDVNLAVADIESDPSRIKPDDENVKLEVVVQNLGDGRARGVQAQLTNLPDGITLSESYSGSEFFGNIEADGTATAAFFIDVDDTVEPKEHTAQLQVNYKYKPDEDEDDFVFEQKNLPLRIAVKPIPLFEITDVELTPAELTAGDDVVKLKLTIKNVGEEEGESVRLKAYGKTEQPFSFDSSSDFVAPSLEPGESGQATLIFDIEKDANLQKYFMDIEIRALVNEDVITYSKKVPVTVTNPRPNNPWPLIIFVLVVAGVIVIYLLVSRHRKKKKTISKKVGRAVEGSYLDSIGDKKKK